MPTQAPLPLDINPAQSFDSYHSGTNSEVTETLRQCAEGKGEQFIFLWGEPGMGKTHLLHACCQSASQHQITSRYLPLNEFITLNPSAAENLDQHQLICLDDIESISKQNQWEQTLFHIFNQVREKGNRLVITSRHPPTRTPIQLPDLANRLAWGLPLQLRPFSDTDKLAAVTLRAKNLGMEITPKVGKFLMNHYSRDLPSLWRLLEELEHATLVAQRKVTVPFLRDYLKSRVGI